VGRRRGLALCCGELAAVVKLRKTGERAVSNREQFKESEYFHNFDAACRWLADDCDDVDPEPLDMALAKIPNEFQVAAFLHAYEFSISALHGEMLGYLQSKGIEQLCYGIFSDFGYAADIRTQYLHNEDSVPSGHIEILRRAASSHGPDFTLSSVDSVMRIDDSNKSKVIGSMFFRRLSVDLKQLSTFCEPESLKSLAVGNRVIQRFARILVGRNVIEESDAVNALVAVEKQFNFDDVGALSTLLKLDFKSDINALQAPLDRCLAGVVGNPLNSQGTEFLVAMLRAKPKQLLEKLINLEAEAFKQVSRGIFLDEYLSCGWMQLGADDYARHDLADTALIDLVDSFNARMLADPIVVANLKHHSAINQPRFSGIESLIMLPRLKDAGLSINLSYLDVAEELSGLIKNVHAYSHFAPYCQSALDGLRQTFNVNSGALYDQFAATEQGKDLPDPATMSLDQKFDYLAIRLGCELRVSEDDAEHAFKHPETPIVNFTENGGSDCSLGYRDLWLPTLFTEIARRSSEQDILNAIGDRVTHFRHLIAHDIIDRKHLARLPLKEQGDYFSKDLGL
jgi:hypothetical protein